MNDLYHEVLLAEAKHPQNRGQLTDADLELGQSNASCGDQVRVFVKLDPVTKAITALKWDGDGCIVSQAAMSLVSQVILDQEMTVEQVAALSQAEVEELLGVENISPGRVKCLMIGVSAFKQAQKSVETGI